MDTIFALASAPGKAGVSVVRVSGEQAWLAVETLCGSVPPVRQAALSVLRTSDGGFLDQALVIAFEAGASFTGERIAEFHVHGSTAVIRAVLAELGTFSGFRMATAGEFTRRALENGCLDLTQVEALADLIESETESQRLQALKILSGALTDEVMIWRRKLVNAAALLEVTIDFVDEDVPVDVEDEVIALLTEVRVAVQRQLSGLSAAERIRSGFEVAIVGPPNAGKSTLLNCLAGREAAITSDIAGTTRDVIEVRMDVRGLAVTVLDTAGIRETGDVVEQLGVQRAMDRASAADLRVHLLCAGEPPLVPVQPGDIVRIPKKDDGGANGISGKTGAGVNELLDAIEAVLSTRVASAGLASNERHRANLTSSLAHLDFALESLSDKMLGIDLVSEELRLAARHLESLVGKIGVEDLLDEIFSSFCIGK